MHITILTIGTRGDIQPYIALGMGLHQAGYDVRLVTHAPFESMIRRYGLDFAPIASNMQAHFQSQEGRAFLASGSNPWRFLRGLQHQAKQQVAQTIKDCWTACQDSDVIIASLFSCVIGYHIATRLKRPFIQAYTQPFHPTTAFPNPLFPIPYRKSRLLNLLTYWLGNLIVWSAIRPYTNSALRQIDIRPSSLPHLEIIRSQLPVLYAYSPSVLPKAKSWGEWIDVVGYWVLEQEEWTPPPALIDFLAAGPAPVYVGFGSMVDGDPKGTTEMVLAALKKTGQRGLLLTGWGGLSQMDLPDDVFVMQKAPHDWLFPQMAAVVHHGGSGTTAAALRAGVPNIIIPFFFDQFLWGERVFELGVGPRPIPRQKLSVERLADAINQTVNNPTMEAKVSTLSQRLRAEKGVERAVEIITRYLKRAPT